MAGSQSAAPRPAEEAVGSGDGGGGVHTRMHVLYVYPYEGAHAARGNWY